MNKKIFLIAEIGNNHEGNFKNAKKLVYNAYLAGADAVKFQIFKTDLFVSRKNTKSYKKFKKFELSHDLFLKLKRYAKSLGLIFFGSAFDAESLKFLKKQSSLIKVASSENDNMNMICDILSSGKKCILSTGFLKFSEVQKLVNHLNRKFGKIFVRKKLSLLHCVSSYPAEKNDLNLSVIKEYKKQFNLKVGYSDHSMGTKACELAVYQGAEIIEKHFTLSKNFSEFRDHQLSSDLKDLKNLRKNLESAKIMLGKKKKIITFNEEKNLKACRRSYYLKRKVTKGEKIYLNDLVLLRPLITNSANLNNIKNYLGKKYRKDFNKDEVLK